MQEKNKTKKISCSQCTQQLFAYVSDALDDSAASVVRAHLQSCSVCQEEYQKIQGMLEVLHSVSVPPLSESFSASLHNRLCDAAEEVRAKEKESLRQRIGDWVAGLQMGPSWRVALSAVACMVLLVGVMSTGLHQNWHEEGDVFISSTEEQMVGDKQEQAQNSTVATEPQKADSHARQEEVIVAGGKVAETKVAKEKQKTTRQTAAEKEPPARQPVVAATETEATKQSHGEMGKDAVPMVVGTGTEAFSGRRSIDETGEETGRTEAEDYPVPASLSETEDTEREETIYQVEVPDAEVYLKEYEQKTGVDLKDNMVQVDPPTLRLTVDAGEKLLDYNRQEAVKTQQIQQGSGTDLLVILSE